MLLNIAGYLLAVVIGATLGLIGGGGSILTVPVLVYVVGVPPLTATAYSLFVVGLSALIGAGGYLRRGDVRVDVAVGFGVPAVISVFLTRLYLVPALPATLFRVGDITVTRDTGIMVLFALLMVLASVSMIRRDPPGQHVHAPRSTGTFLLAVVAEGVVVGVLTGLVGAGGGFLIVPALVVLARLPMKTAVGTSLVIIAGKSLIGFLGDVESSAAVDWRFLLAFAAMTAVGILIGMAASRRVSAARLKPAFGWFVLIAGAAIMIREVVAV